MQAFVTAGAGFLLAVLWFDLMHDVQARGEISDADLESIATYYARVTTGARPMNRLIALVMVGTIAAAIAGVVGDSVPAWAAWSSLVLVVVPIAVAGTATVPMAVQLGRGAVELRRGTGPREGRREQARLILRQHLFCLACIATVLVIQLASL